MSKQPARLGTLATFAPGKTSGAKAVGLLHPKQLRPAWCALHRWFKIRQVTFRQSNPLATQQEILAFIAREFPQTKCTVLDVGQGGATVAHEVGPAELRPGGTVSGPVLMATADVALYVAILGEIGIVPLTVTTSLNINFLRKPASSARIIGICKLIKLGRTLAVGEVSLYSEGHDLMVAHAVGTYAIPASARAVSLKS